jgi:hypothetical protein
MFIWYQTKKLRRRSRHGRHRARREIEATYASARQADGYDRSTEMDRRMVIMFCGSKECGIFRQRTNMAMSAILEAHFVRNPYSPRSLPSFLLFVPFIFCPLA